jgi:hypothetical protein
VEFKIYSWASVRGLKEGCDAKKMEIGSELVELGPQIHRFCLFLPLNVILRTLAGQWSVRNIKICTIQPFAKVVTQKLWKSVENFGSYEGTNIFSGIFGHFCPLTSFCGPWQVSVV